MYTSGLIPHTQDAEDSEPRPRVPMPRPYPRPIDQQARPMVEHIRQHREPGQLYLIPPQLQTFRLAAGISIFVDWKTVPFGDEGVLEWYRRYRLAESFYEAQPAQRWTMLATLVQNERITHVVLHTETLGEMKPPSYVVETFRSPVYTVYKIRP